MDELVTRKLLLQSLESLARAGVDQLQRGVPLGVLPASAATAARPDSPAASMPLPSPPAATADRPMPTRLSAPTPPPFEPRLAVPATSDLEPVMAKKSAAKSAACASLDDLKAEVAGCKLCKELARTRKQTVFGVGNPQPRVVIFGEAPGADEDRTGEPFVGRAGQLLTKIIEACGWKREEVYILNVLKCRPPDNRTPVEEEIENCRPFFERQIELLAPEYIVCVGTVPSQALLRTKEPVGRLRGRFHEYNGRSVLVTYHPSYLLRNPSAKKFVWDDMQMLLKKMGIEPPKSK